MWYIYIIELYSAVAKYDIMMLAENGYTGNYYLKLILLDSENQILSVSYG